VIIDCPPNVGVLTFNALLACSEVIIPLDPSFFSLHGIGKMLETLDLLERKTDHAVRVHALLTLYAGRSEFAKEIGAEIRRHLGDRALNTVIRFSVKLGEAASHGIPICDFCTRCVGFEDYGNLAAEIIRQESALPLSNSIERLEHKRTSDAYSLPSAPVPTENGVLFTLDAPQARHVQVAGDFNSWMPDDGEMEFSGGIWRKMLSLEPGRYRYRYIIDGQWQADPLNDCVEPSPFGDNDSVIDLRQANPGN